MRKSSNHHPTDDLVGSRPAMLSSTRLMVLKYTYVMIYKIYCDLVRHSALKNCGFLVMILLGHAKIPLAYRAVVALGEKRCFSSLEVIFSCNVANLHLKYSHHV